MPSLLHSTSPSTSSNASKSASRSTASSASAGASTHPPASPSPSQLAALLPRFKPYERANQVNAHPWLVDLLIWRAQKSKRLVHRMSGVLNETAHPGQLFTARGIYKLFTE